MAKKAGLLRAALVIGGTAVAAILSKKENRDRVLEEYNKAKENPEAYKQQVVNKAQDMTQVAKDEVAKVKEDPQAYKSNLVGTVKEKVSKEDATNEQVSNFDDEGGANNIHVVTDPNNLTENNPNAVKK